MNRGDVASYYGSRCFILGVYDNDTCLIKFDDGETKYVSSYELTDIRSNEHKSDPITPLVIDRAVEPEQMNFFSNPHRDPLASKISGANHSGSMVALYPSMDDKNAQMMINILSKYATEPIEDFHITLAYLPNSDNFSMDTLVEAFKNFSFPPINITITGLAEFNPSDHSPFGTIVALCDSISLVDLRSAVLGHLSLAGLEDEVSSNHGFIPHITLCYKKSYDEHIIIDYVAEVGCSFNKISLVRKGERMDIPMSKNKTSVAFQVGDKVYTPLGDATVAGEGSYITGNPEDGRSVVVRLDSNGQMAEFLGDEISNHDKEARLAYWSKNDALVRRKVILASDFLISMSRLWDDFVMIHGDEGSYSAWLQFCYNQGDSRSEDELAAYWNLKRNGMDGPVDDTNENVMINDNDERFNIRYFNDGSIGITIIPL